MSKTFRYISYGINFHFTRVAWNSQLANRREHLENQYEVAKEHLESQVVVYKTLKPVRSISHCLNLPNPAVLYLLPCITVILASHLRELFHVLGEYHLIVLDLRPYFPVLSECGPI
jgi:hypothetical protein